MRGVVWALPVFLILMAPACAGQQFSDFTTPVPLPDNSALVIGFLGGFEHWDDSHRGVRKTALRLRSRGLYAETVENHRRSLARRLIYKALDANRDGRLDAREKSRARIILYGQSLGGWAVVRLARELDKAGISVLLTVQVDSVGIADAVIPANVHAAANLFQRDFWPLRGAPQIRAADPKRTRILGNFQYHYDSALVVSPDESVARMVLMGAHNKMELDPAVWEQVEGLIASAIAP